MKPSEATVVVMKDENGAGAAMCAILKNAGYSVISLGKGTACPDARRVSAAYFVKPAGLGEIKAATGNTLEPQTLSQENGRLAGELQSANKLLGEANVELKKLCLARAEFLAQMSHELRTPLNIIIGFSELMLDGVPGELNEEQEQCLNDILTSSRGLLKMINDLLDPPKVKPGKKALKPGNSSPAGRGKASSMVRPPAGVV